MLRKSAVRLFTIIFLPLVACQSPGGQARQPTELPTPVLTAPPTAAPTPTPIEDDFVEFETIELSEGGVNVNLENNNAELLLLTSSQDVSLLQGRVHPETVLEVQNINFDKYAVIVLFRGLKPSYNYQTVIERITQQDGQLTVSAQFWEPSPQWASAAALTSPYHIVKFLRSDLQNDHPELVLQTVSITPTPPAP